MIRSCRVLPGPTAPSGAASIFSSPRSLLGATHGWGIGLRIQELPAGRLDANQGSSIPPSSASTAETSPASGDPPRTTAGPGATTITRQGGARWDRSGPVASVRGGDRPGAGGWLEPAPWPPRPARERPSAERRQAGWRRSSCSPGDGGSAPDLDGLSPEAARRQARVTFEAWTRTVDDARRARSAMARRPRCGRPVRPPGHAAEPRLRPRRGSHPRRGDRGERDGRGT